MGPCLRALHIGGDPTLVLGRLGASRNLPVVRATTFISENDRPCNLSSRLSLMSLSTPGVLNLRDASGLSFN